jgi:alpha-galactosidase
VTTTRVTHSASHPGHLDVTVDGQIVSRALPYILRTHPLTPEDGDTLHSHHADDNRVEMTWHRGDLVIDWSATRVGEESVWELALAITNTGEGQIAITRADPLQMELPGDWSLQSFHSAWGDEFRAQHGTTRHHTFVGSRSGRSSHGYSPLVIAHRDDHPATVIVSPAWSGNWHIDVLSGGYVSAGISPWNLAIPVPPGHSVDVPTVVLAVDADHDSVRDTLTRAVRDAWIPRTPATDAIPIEWNHWWPYEDQEVNEDVIAHNADIAATLGVDTIVVDAGWFGDTDQSSHWQEQRGDWDRVNHARFPSGLAGLGDAIRQRGLVPGIWVEVEAVGAHSHLRHRVPEAMAMWEDTRRPDPTYRRQTESLDPNDPGFLGYVCLGSEAGWNHAYQSLSNVITDMGAHWLKLDFNVDPDFGCTRTDHGHGAGDGLFRHYQGLYRLLDTLRDAFPHLLVEACSSGGLRLDLGLARHVHCFFLSDPDYTDHHLNTLWGVSALLPPLAILHWPWSWWRGNFPPNTLDWGTLETDRFDMMVRAALLHRPGLSYPLPLLHTALVDRLRHHLAVFSTHIRPILPRSTLSPLTPSPERGGGGERSSVWQLSADVGQDSEQHILAGFQLDGQHHRAPFSLRHLDPGALYRVTDTDSGAHRTLLGENVTDQAIWEFAGDVRSFLITLSRDVDPTAVDTRHSPGEE